MTGSEKVRYLYNHVKQTCKALFNPFQMISVDQRMIKSKCRFGFKQYMPKKPTKWGAKVFALCDVKTAYLWNFNIYTGQGEDEEFAEYSHTTSAVLSLTDGFEKQGHVVFTDSFYTSPQLAQALEERGIDLVGTGRTNRTGLPRELKDVKNFERHAERGEMRYLCEGPILFQQWYDKRTVSMLSTYHTRWGTVCM